MVQIIPPTVSHFKTPTEEKMFNLINATLGNDYMVIYGARWKSVKPNRNNNLECDFIIAKRDGAILDLEVKGGIWMRVNGNWYANGTLVYPEDDPLQQGSKNINELIALLRSHKKWANRYFPLDYALAFPDTAFQYATRFINGVKILSSEDLSNFYEWIEEAMQDCLTRSYPSKCDQSMIDYLTQILMKDHTVSLIDILNSDEEKLHVLTEQELRVDNKLKKKKRLTVQGCAGSGKTLMAIKQVKRLEEIHNIESILFTCYNNELGKWLAYQTRYLQAKCTTTPFLTFCEEHLYDLGEISIYEKRTRSYLDSLPYLMLKNIDRLPKYDAIIVDEGQIFQDDWWDLIEMLLKDPNNSYLYIFFDELQRIAAEKQWHVPGEEDPVELNVNVRNTARIHRKATMFLPPDKLPECNKLLGEPVWISFYPDPTNMKNILQKYLNKLIIEGGVSSNNIIILTPHGPKKSALCEEKLGAWNLAPIESEDAAAIKYCTVYDFRGLERQVVILIELNTQSKELEQYIYLGASRAKTKLVMLASAELDAELKQKLAEDCETLF